MLKSKRFWIGIAVTLLCLYFVFRGIKLEALWNAVKQINLWVLLGTVAIYIAGYYIRAIRWHYLLKHIKEFKASELFPYLVMGFMFNNVLPARAGEFIRAYITGTKKGISKASTFATVMIERVFDGLVMIFYFVIGYLAFHYVAQATNIPSINIFGREMGVKDTVLVFAIAGSMVFAGIFAVCVMLIFKKDATIRFLHKILSIFPKKFADAFNRLIDTFIEGLGVLRSLADLAKVFMLTLLAWSIEAGTYWLMAYAMGIQMNFLVVCLVMAVANFAIMAPSTSGGVGPFEFFGLAIMLLFNYPKEQAVTYILLIHTMILLPIIILGAVFVFTEGFNFNQLVNAKKEDK